MSSAASGTKAARERGASPTEVIVAVDRYRQACSVGIAKSPGALGHWLREGAFPFDESLIGVRSRSRDRADWLRRAEELDEDDVRELERWASEAHGDAGKAFLEAMQRERFRVTDRYTKQLVARFLERRHHEVPEEGS